MSSPLADDGGVTVEGSEKVKKVKKVKKIKKKEAGDDEHEAKDHENADVTEEATTTTTTVEGGEEGVTVKKTKKVIKKKVVKTKTSGGDEGETVVTTVTKSIVEGEDGGELHGSKPTSDVVDANAAAETSESAISETVPASVEEEITSTSEVVTKKKVVKKKKVTEVESGSDADKSSHEVTAASEETSSEISPAKDADVPKMDSEVKAKETEKSEVTTDVHEEVKVEPLEEQKKSAEDVISEEVKKEPKKVEVVSDKVTEGLETPIAPAASVPEATEPKDKVEGTSDEVTTLPVASVPNTEKQVVEEAENVTEKPVEKVVTEVVEAEKTETTVTNEVKTEVIETEIIEKPVETKVITTEEVVEASPKSQDVEVAVEAKSEPVRDEDKVVVTENKENVSNDVDHQISKVEPESKITDKESKVVEVKGEVSIEQHEVSKASEDFGVDRVALEDAEKKIKDLKLHLAKSSMLESEIMIEATRLAQDPQRLVFSPMMLSMKTLVAREEKLQSVLRSIRQSYGNLDAELEYIKTELNTKRGFQQFHHPSSTSFIGSSAAFKPSSRLSIK